MASISQPIQIAVDDAATTLYTAFVGAGTRAQLVSLDLTNTTTADITVDVTWVANGGGTTVYLADDLVVPSKGTASWRGMVTMDEAGDTIQAVASAHGVDALGTVVES